MNSQNELAGEHDEVTKAQLGFGILRSLVVLDADEVQNDSVKSYTDGNLKLWKSRSGLDSTQGLLGVGNGKKKMPGNVVRIDSPEYHLGGLAAVIVALVLALTAAGLGLAWLRKPEKPPAAVDTDTDTRSTMRPYTGPEP